MERPETHVTVLPAAGREEQLERHGLTRSHRWGEADTHAHHGGDELDPLDAHEAYDRELQEVGFLQDGGWSAVDTTRGRTLLAGATGGARDAGMSSHRGVIHPHEHVDAEALRTAVESELGFTYWDVHAVYRQGRKSPAQLELRERIDARLLELSASGTNLALLGRLLGFHVNANGACEALNNALERARKGGK